MNRSFPKFCCQAPGCKLEKTMPLEDLDAAINAMEKQGWRHSGEGWFCKDHRKQWARAKAAIAEKVVKYAAKARERSREDYSGR